MSRPVIVGRTLALEDRHPGAAMRAGLYVRTIGGPGGVAELDGEDVDELVDALEEWRERYGRGRRA
jgi:hypothetical protein